MPGSVERWTKALTILGAAPFYLALGVHFVAASPVNPSAVFLTYGAVIASFMTGTIWGLALRAAPARKTLLIASNILALSVWAGALIGGTVALALQLVVFLALLPCDKVLHDAGLEPRWYWSLRKGVTLLVVLAYGGAFLVL